MSEYYDALWLGDAEYESDISWTRDHPNFRWCGWNPSDCSPKLPERREDGRRVARKDGIQIVLKVIYKYDTEIEECALWPRKPMSWKQFINLGSKLMQKMHCDLLVDVQTDLNTWSGKQPWTLKERLPVVVAAYNAASWAERGDPLKLESGNLSVATNSSTSESDTEDKGESESSAKSASTKRKVASPRLLTCVAAEHERDEKTDPGITSKKARFNGSDRIWSGPLSTRWIPPR
jgi:hypothetical protein